MGEILLALFDPVALAIVLAGTALATIARCGLADSGAGIAALLHLRRAEFDPHANRAALARFITEIRQRGHLCARTRLPPDRELAKLVKHFEVHGSVEGVQQMADSARAAREVRATQASRLFTVASDLAPVFGLVGTLVAITQIGLPAPEIGPETGTLTAAQSAPQVMMASVSTAALSSLYGVLTAHLVCGPLAGAIDRASMAEEAARQDLIAWFEGALIEEGSRTPPRLFQPKWQDAA